MGPGFYKADARRAEAAEERIDSGEYVKDRDIEW